jgi:hypothetical protein
VWQTALYDPFVVPSLILHPVPAWFWHQSSALLGASGGQLQSMRSLMLLLLPVLCSAFTALHFILQGYSIRVWLICLLLPVWRLQVWLPCCGWQLQGAAVSISRRALQQHHQVRAAVGHWQPLREHGQRAAVLEADLYVRGLMVNVCN